MKKKVLFYALMLMLSAIAWSCKSNNDEISPDKNTSSKVNEKLNLKLDIQKVTVPSTVDLDINSDGVKDFHFEIINVAILNLDFPYPDSFSVTVTPLNGSQILDNSMYGYPDAMNKGAVIAGNWSTKLGILGTFHNGAQFKGAGQKYLGIKVKAGDDYYIGWILLDCAANVKTLDIIEYGLNLGGLNFKAGE